jgi:hypothetical protein
MVADRELREAVYGPSRVEEVLPLLEEVDRRKS